MRLLIPVALIAAPAASAPPAPGAPPPAAWKAECPDFPRVVPADGSGKAQPKKLAELPPGDLILGVYRQENGCPRPVIVRHGYGSVEVPAAPRSPAPAEAPRFRARRW